MSKISLSRVANGFYCFSRMTRTTGFDAAVLKTSEADLFWTVIVKKYKGGKRVSEERFNAATLKEARALIGGLYSTLSTIAA